MRDILRSMCERISVLKKAITKAEKEVNQFPEGRLRINTSEHRIRYYHMLQRGDNEGNYIPKKQIMLAGQLAQKDYNSKFLEAAKLELSRLEQLIVQLTKENADIAYDNLSPERKSLITPYIQTDAQYAMAWQAKSYKANTFMAENKIYDTRRGEKVRSKSEAILADMFLELGIPYHYERPLNLRSGKTVYPDFTLLNRRTRKEVYFEHFGLLDDGAYLNGALQKLDGYRDSGIFPGKNLIFSYETEEYPLDIKGIREMLKGSFK